MPNTQITTRQIADGQITDAKVAAGAAIATSKLADALNFILRGGSVAFTGNQSMGGNLITNLATPGASGDAANKGYVDTQISNLNSLFDSKGSARAATTGNITVSNPGTSTFDTVSLNNGDRLFLRAQTAPAEQGLYTFNGSAAPLTRVADMDAWTEIPGAFFAVEEGSAWGDSLWLCTSNQGGTLGSTAITFQNIPVSAGLSNTNFVDKEIPSGSINGSNVTYTLANTPVSGSDHLYVNGVLQESGSGNDYTISSTTITMAVAPGTGEKIRVSYRK
jgi:hypothetical protein